MECRIPKTVLIVIVVAVLGVGAAAVAIPHERAQVLRDLPYHQALLR